MRSNLFFLILLAFIPVLASAATPQQTMAEILLELNHFPSDENKAALSAITSGSAKYNEKVLAGAISRVAHKVSDDDREALEEMLDDPDLAPPLQTIAKAIMGINHKVQAGDASNLRKLLK